MTCPNVRIFAPGGTERTSESSAGTREASAVRADPRAARPADPHAVGEQKNKTPAEGKGSKAQEAHQEEQAQLIVNRDRLRNDRRLHLPAWCKSAMHCDSASSRKIILILQNFLVAHAGKVAKRVGHRSLEVPLREVSESWSSGVRKVRGFEFPWPPFAVGQVFPPSIIYLHIMLNPFAR